MRHSVTALTFLTLGSTLGCLGVASPPSQEVQHSADNRYEDVVLKYLRSALSSSHKGARVYYRGACGQGLDPVQFPLIEVQPPPAGTKGLAAVQGIFENSKDAKIEEEPSGVITITIGEVSTAMLQTKISLLRLQPEERYDPDVAIRAILNADEVQAGLEKLGLKLPLELGGPVTLPHEGLPHLPSSMQNKTVAQALESIARTFRGIVVYGECRAEGDAGLVVLYFADVNGFNGAR